MVKKILVTIITCDVCGYSWIPNRRPPFTVESEDDLPKYCSNQKCHSPHYNKNSQKTKQNKEF